MTLTQPAPTLDQLPAEVLESVIILLPFLDICSLRLVSRTVAAKSSQGTFQKYFTAKTVKLISTEQMQDFVYLTRPGWMGCLLQRLSLVGEAPPTGQEHTLGKLLTKALTNLRLNSIHGCLQSITLLVQGQDDNGNIVPCKKVRGWRQIWLSTARTFEIACRAVVESALPIEKLDIFGSLSRCSLACDQIAPILDSIDLSKPLEKLKCLSLSLSHHVAEDPESDVLWSVEVGTRHAKDIFRLLELCPQLENLHLHWYDLYIIKLSDAQDEEKYFFNHITQLKQLSLSRLRYCQLEGIYTNEMSLLTLFQKATELSHLNMEEIHLTQGKFSPVFDYLTNHLQHLEYLHLDDLWENRLVCFDGPGKSHFPYSSPSGPNDLTRIGLDDCRRTIKYFFPSGHSMGSAAAANWHRRKTLLYGPPGSGSR